MVKQTAGHDQLGNFAEIIGIYTALVKVEDKF